ncbi:MAG TPA: hypothetical protein VKV73_17955 [Chloroflexota bacterium]|nr:hypothetical protein [Chloroflexota bacterium]
MIRATDEPEAIGAEIRNGAEAIVGGNYFAFADSNAGALAPSESAHVQIQQR